MVTLEAKIETIRARNPLQPIPFELFPQFCQSWIKNCSEDTETALSQLRDFNEREKLADRRILKEEAKAEEPTIRKRNKTSGKVKLSGSLRSFGQISADCIKLDRGLKLLMEKIDRMELEVKGLKAIDDVMSKNATKYRTPSAKMISQKVTELEQTEKELLNIALKVNEEESKDVTS